VFKNPPFVVSPMASVSGTRLSHRKSPSAGPSWPRIVCHAMVLIRNEVKNGTMIRPSSTARNRCARNAMKYASG
jgi:hypothetical protein